MYCKKCGNQLPDNARFCSKCGSAIMIPAANHTTISGAPRKAAVQHQSKDKRSFFGKAIAILLVVAVIAGVFFILFFAGRNTIDLKEMYKIEVYGDDGYGYADVEVDEDVAIEWLCNQAGIRSEDVDIYELLNPFNLFGNFSFSDGMDLESYTKEVFGKSISEKQLKKIAEDIMKKLDVMDSIDYEITPDDDLENGDTIKIKFTYDKEAAKEAGLRFKNTKWTYKVKGLSTSSD